MVKYYIGNSEVSKYEYEEMFGNDEIRNYVIDLYYENITLSDVPEKHQEKVQKIVDNRIERFGEATITTEEFYRMIEEVI